MGGASSQNTFHPNENILSNFYDVHINHIEKRLYTHSYLYYGNNESRKSQ